MPAPGDLLIAPARMPDQRFRNAVLLLAHNGSQGTFALCMNKPTSRVIHEVLEQQDLSAQLNMPLYWGGPVNPQTIWMLHSTEWHTEHTIVINRYWSMTSHSEMFVNIADGDYPDYFRVFTGFAAWGVGQLDMELAGRQPWRPESSWLVASTVEPAWMLEQAETDLWSSAVELSAKQAVGQWM